MTGPINPMTPSTPSEPDQDSSQTKTWLDRIEWLGNKLPEPAILFAILAAIVVFVSGAGALFKWSVQPVELRIAMVDSVNPETGEATKVKKLDEAGKPVVELIEAGEPLKPRSLMTKDGIYWMLSSMVRNFTGLPALGLIFVSMLGIGLAEKFGIFSAFMRCVALATPKSIITPMVIFIGANSSVASDAGYIILPPLAAALYGAIGRSPIAGFAAAFAGVSGGFGGGIFPTAADGFLAGVATQAAHIIDPKYPDVLATHNLYFKSASAVVIMLAGWFVTDKIVEPRLQRQALAVPPDTSAMTSMALTPVEKKGLMLAGLVMLAILGTFAAMVLIPEAPLHGRGTLMLANGKPVPFEREGDRWSQVIVPMIFLTFILPGMTYGFITGVLRTQKDFIDAIYHGIRSIVPVLAIAFFMGQFVNYFQYTGLDRMLAYAGGSLLLAADLPVPLLIVLFVMLVICGDFAISGMLSKFGVLAPIFIPMFMMVGMSPELTTAAYRIGDSVVNIITPLNSYLLIILVGLQKYKPKAGLGSLISLMLPYSIVFALTWTGFLLLWYFSGMDLGTKAPLVYIPTQ